MDTIPHWQAHATFAPSGEMYFGLKADSPEEAREQAGTRLANFGLPVARLEVDKLPGPEDR
jgi:hypothetical protein